MGAAVFIAFEPNSTTGGDGGGPSTVVVTSPITGDGSDGSPIDFKFNVRTITSYSPIPVAAPWDCMQCKGSGGSVKLPASPAKGDEVSIIAVTANITLLSNGHNFTNGASSAVIVQGESFTFVYSGTDWSPKN